MLKDGTAATARNDKGGGLLHYVRDNEDLVSRLIAAGCDVNLKTKEHYTPLMLAIESGYSKQAKLLLEAGASPDVIFPYEDYRPLHLAAFYGYVDIVKSLIKAGADLNAIDEEKCTPLHRAIKVIDDPSCNDMGNCD